MSCSLRKTLLAAAALPLIGWGGAIVTVEPGFAQAQSQSRGDPQMKVSTSEYVQKAAMGDMFEIESSKIAAEKAQNKEVKDFAQKMVKDHTESTKMITEASAKGKVNATMPKELDAEHKAKLEKLRSASGAEFDRQYVTMQMEAHEKAMQLHAGYAKTGDNEQLKEAAEDIAEHVEDHLDDIKDIQKSMSKS